MKIFQIKNQKVAGVILGLILLFLGVSGNKLSEQTLNSSSTETPNAQQQVLDHKDAAPANKTDKESSQTFYLVTSVPDGDTLRVKIADEETKVRLIGINTPELEGATGAVSCFGQKAAEKARAVLEGKKVRLESDPSQNDRDKFDRLLRFAFLEDGTNFAEMMIREGFAYEYTYNAPYKFQKEFKAAQTEARQNQKGLWAPNACGKEASSDTTLQSTAPPSTPATTPAATPPTAAIAPAATAAPSSAEKFYTSSRSNAKYYYPSACKEWQDLSPTYLRSFASVEELLAEFPNRKPSPKCQ